MKYPELKPFQRVVTQNGNKYIVIPACADYRGLSDVKFSVKKGDMVLISSGSGYGWTYAKFERGSEGTSAGYEIVKVYEAPSSITDSLDYDEKGGLVWDRDEAFADDSATKTRIAYFQTHIDAVEEQLEHLKSAFKRLKDEVK